MTVIPLMIFSEHMTISDLLSQLQDDQSVLIDGRTFEPKTIDEVELQTGEMVYWVRDNDHWLSIDEEAEEVILFEDIEEDIEMDTDTLIYRGDDFELSQESEGMLMDGVQQLDSVTYRDFENADGEIFRIIQEGMSSDLYFAFGRKLTEEQLQDLS